MTPLDQPTEAELERLSNAEFSKQSLSKGHFPSEQEARMTGIEIAKVIARHNPGLISKPDPTILQRTIQRAVTRELSRRTSTDYVAEIAVEPKSFIRRAPELNTPPNWPQLLPEIKSCVLSSALLPPSAAMDTYQTEKTGRMLDYAAVAVTDPQRPIVADLTATSGGKTRMELALAKACSLNGLKVLWASTGEGVIGGKDGALKAFQSCFDEEEIGLYHQDRHETGRSVTVTNFNNLRRPNVREAMFSGKASPSVIILDEGDLMQSELSMEIFEDIESRLGFRPLIFVHTATRSIGGRDLASVAHITDRIMPLDDVIRRGRAKHIIGWYMKIKQHLYPEDLSSLEHGNDPNDEAFDFVKKACEDMTQIHAQHHPGQKGLFLHAHVRSARKNFEILTDAGINCRLVTGENTHQFETFWGEYMDPDSDVEVLVGTEVIGRGSNDNGVTQALYIPVMTRSLARLTQWVGRGVRPDGKDNILTAYQALPRNMGDIGKPALLQNLIREGAQASPSVETPEFSSPAEAVAFYRDTISADPNSPIVGAFGLSLKLPPPIQAPPIQKVRAAGEGWPQERQPPAIDHKVTINPRTLQPIGEPISHPAEFPTNSPRPLRPNLPPRTRTTPTIISGPELAAALDTRALVASENPLLAEFTTVFDRFLTEQVGTEAGIGSFRYNDKQTISLEGQETSLKSFFGAVLRYCLAVRETELDVESITSPQVAGMRLAKVWRHQDRLPDACQIEDIIETQAKNSYLPKVAVRYYQDITQAFLVELGVQSVDDLSLSKANLTHSLTIVCGGEPITMQLGIFLRSFLAGMAGVPVKDLGGRNESTALRFLQQALSATEGLDTINIETLREEALMQYHTSRQLSEDLEDHFMPIVRAFIKENDLIGSVEDLTETKARQTSIVHAGKKLTYDVFVRAVFSAIFERPASEFRNVKGSRSIVPRLITQWYDTGRKPETAEAEQLAREYKEAEELVSMPIEHRKQRANLVLAEQGYRDDFDFACVKIGDFMRNVDFGIFRSAKRMFVLTGGSKALLYGPSEDLTGPAFSHIPRLIGIPPITAEKFRKRAKDFLGKNGITSKDQLLEIGAAGLHEIRLGSYPGTRLLSLFANKPVSDNFADFARSELEKFARFLFPGEDRNLGPPNPDGYRPVLNAPERLSLHEKDGEFFLLQKHSKDYAPKQSRTVRPGTSDDGLTHIEKMSATYQRLDIPPGASILGTVKGKPESIVLKSGDKLLISEPVVTPSVGIYTPIDLETLAAVFKFVIE